VKTKSGATAVQVVYSSPRGSREIEHLGPAHDEAGLEALKAAARQRMAAGGDEVFRHLVLARIIEPASELDSLRVQAGQHTITAADPIPDDLRQALERIHRYAGARKSGPAREEGPGQ
jgi:hypothetical protein